MPLTQGLIQRRLFDVQAAALGVHGTYLPNYRVAVHRWYPYIEGFSAEFVERLIDEYAAPGFRIYDPFAGTGTTVTVAAGKGAIGYYSEINPFMRLVIECKTNLLKQLSRRTSDLTAYFDKLYTCASRLPSEESAAGELAVAFGNRPYFRGRRLVEIVALRRALLDLPPVPAFGSIGKLALASIAIACSEMKRASDLRYRTACEHLPDDLSPLEEFRKKCHEITADLDAVVGAILPVSCLCESALARPTLRDAIDVVITSPPYVNGTNYFRNTKLELWLTGMLDRESELGTFRDAAMAAGINDISRRGRTPTRIPAVEAIATRLDKVAYDVRIPELVRRYFSDSLLWIGNVSQLLRDGGTAVIDIGDSRFAGVHVPADELLIDIAQGCGLSCTEVREVRKRTSKDGEPLRQSMLILKKTASPRISVAAANGTRLPRHDDFRETAIKFGRSLPHLDPPYSSRNWGHGLHSLCCYQGKLKPAIAHFLVAGFSRPGETVLDPFSGSGTIPLEAFLQGRRAIGNDIQELGFTLTRAKVERGASDEATDVLQDMLKDVEEHADAMDAGSYADFGLNGRIPEYFHPDTYREVLAARSYMRLLPCDSWGRAVVYASMLHILHGNRPYALSRRSHPVTPFKPTGPTEYRPLAVRLRDKVNRCLAEPLVDGVLAGSASQCSFEQLVFRGAIDVIITSPPFAGSTRFFSSNWLRLWMAGWEPGDFSSRPAAFLESQQLRSMDVYDRFFELAAQWLRPGGRLVMHAGRTDKINMAEDLSTRGRQHFELVHWFDEDVAGREKFGVRDQGATTLHQYLFFRRA